MKFILRFVVHEVEYECGLNFITYFINLDLAAMIIVWLL